MFFQEKVYAYKKKKRSIWCYTNFGFPATAGSSAQNAAGNIDPLPSKTWLITLFFHSGFFVPDIYVQNRGIKTAVSGHCVQCVSIGAIQTITTSAPMLTHWT